MSKENPGGERVPPESKARSSARAPGRVDYAALISGGVRRTSTEAPGRSPQAVVEPEGKVGGEQLQEDEGVDVLVPAPIEESKEGQVGPAGVHPAPDVAAERQEGVETVSRQEGGAAESQGLTLEIAPGVIVRFADKKGAEAWILAQTLKAQKSEQMEVKLVEDKRMEKERAERLKRKNELDERQRAAVQEEALLTAQDALMKAEQDAVALTAKADAELARILKAKVQGDFERDEARRALALLEAKAEKILNENVEVRQVLAVAEVRALEAATILIEKDEAIKALTLKEAEAREYVEAESEREDARRMAFRLEAQKEREEEGRRQSQFLEEAKLTREGYESFRKETEAANLQSSRSGQASRQELILAAAAAEVQAAQQDLKGQMRE